jgi:uncharacterized protein (TIGR03492 family)
MPSGGLIAMGNVRNIARDLACGLIGHTLAQLRFLRGVRGRYRVAVAVGDIFALAMALQARAQTTIFVGTAKSVHYAKYGRAERRLIRRAQRVFVRDEATALDLKRSGIDAQAANVIVDLYADPQAHVDVPFDPLLAVFPGSRENAYADAASLCAVVRQLALDNAGLGAVLSVAPGLDPARMGSGLTGCGRIAERGDPLQPFSLYDGNREIVRAWRGPLGAMLERATIVLGQAGTANEAAASAGIPVIAYEPDPKGRRAWYRMRQAGLLGDALAIAGGAPGDAAREITALLRDPQRRARMGEAGRARMGPPGGARAIAAAIRESLGA